MSTYSFKGDKRIWTPRLDDDNRNDNAPVIPEITMKSSTKPESSKWNIFKIIRLLRLYGAHENLWNANHEDFRDRKLRKAALVDIAAALGGRTTTALVVQKINVLRATYRYEKRRIKQRMRKGIGATTKLKWFALADSFLRHVPKMGRARRKDNKLESESDLEHEMILTMDPEAVVPYDTEAIDKNTESRIKKEAKTETSTDSPKLLIKKFKWTREHSVRFVQLLVNQPILWSEKIVKDDDNESNALESLAFHMGLSIFDAKRKVQTFKETYNAEMLKINEFPNYRPQFVWWQLAESFMPQKENLIDFVDTNAMIPPTPFSILDNPQSPLTPINPLPSVSIDDAQYESNKDDDTYTQKDGYTSTQLNKQNNFNSLEDDLLDGKWSLKHSVKFLRLYGAHRCLWDLNSPEYRCRNLRSAAIEDIAAAMGHGLDGEYVAKKIKIFRITYMQHRKRMLAAIKAGQEPDIQLRWFPLADSFLRPHIGLRSIKEQELEIPQFNYQYVMANLNLIDPELLNDFR